MTDARLGWAAATLADVATLLSGSTPKGLSSVSGGRIPFYKVADMNRADGNVMAEAGIYLDSEGVSRYRLRLAPAGTVIMPKVGGAIATNKKRLLKRPATFDTNTLGVVPAAGIFPEFVFYRLQALDLRDLAYGSPVPQINRQKLLQLEIGLPSLAEQKRIVAAIEEQFSRLDAADIALKRVRQRLGRLRASLSERVFRADWKWATTGDVAEVQGGIQKQPKRRPAKNRAPFLRVANVPRSGLDLTEVHEVELFEGELERYRLRPGDLLVVEGNGSIEQIGRSTLWHGEIPDCVHQNHLIRVRPGPTVLPAFLSAYWNSPATRKRLAELASSTSGLYTLSTAKVRAVPVPIVSRDEQQHLVDQLQRDHSIADALEARTQEAQRRATVLRRSILAHAFGGELVPQDLDDEPASLLLERIAEERTARTKPSRRGRIPG